MNERLYDALEVSLKALEMGAVPESVVMLFPELKEDLLPLLETSSQAKMLAVREVPEAALRRNRVRVLQHAAGMRQAFTRSKKPGPILRFPRLAVSLTVALLFLFSGTGLVRASNSALPGDNLYPVKRTWEDMRLLLVFNPESREELESEFEQERLYEVDELLAKGRHETIMFAGVVTEQRGNLWIVSGVPVQITAESRLPSLPILIGASVMLQGRTNPQGFVEASSIMVLGSDVVLPTSVPTPIELPGEDSNLGNPSAVGNDHTEIRTQFESPLDEGYGNNYSEEDRIDHNDNSNSGRNESEYNEDQIQDSEQSEDRRDEDKSDDEKSGENRSDDNDDDDKSNDGMSENSGLVDGRDENCYED